MLPAQHTKKEGTLFDEYESAQEDVFDIPSKHISTEILREWKKATLVLNAAHRFVSAWGDFCLQRTSFGVVDMIETLDEDSTNAVSCLLELAASNDLAGFKELIEEGKAKVDSTGNWYCRHNGMS